MITAILIILIVMLIVTILNMFMMSSIVAYMAKWNETIKVALDRIEFYFSNDDE